MLRTISVGCWGRAFAEVAKAAFQRPDQCTAYHHLTQRRGSQTPGRWLSALRSRPREEWVRRDARCDKQELSVGRAVLGSVHSFRARGRDARVAPLPRVPGLETAVRGMGEATRAGWGLGYRVGTLAVEPPICVWSLHGSRQCYQAISFNDGTQIGSSTAGPSTPAPHS